MPGQVGGSGRNLLPYYRKKLAEGKSRKEALRCLKRRISDAVYKSLVADLQTPSSSAA
jgi:transposase